MKVFFFICWINGAIASGIIAYSVNCQASKSTEIHRMINAASIGSLWPIIVICRAAVWGISPEIAKEPLGCTGEKQP